MNPVNFPDEWGIRDDAEYGIFFIDGEAFIADPYKYLEGKYGIPFLQSKGYALMWKSKGGMKGVPKSQLDAIGR